MTMTKGRRSRRSRARSLARDRRSFLKLALAGAGVDCPLTELGTDILRDMFGPRIAAVTPGSGWVGPTDTPASVYQSFDVSGVDTASNELDTGTDLSSWDTVFPAQLRCEKTYRLMVSGVQDAGRVYTLAVTDDPNDDQDTVLSYEVQPGDGSTEVAAGLVAAWNGSADAKVTPYTAVVGTSGIELKFTNPATGGTFTITAGGETTAPIAYDASTATVQAAVEALSTVSSATVTGAALSTSNARMVIEVSGHLAFTADLSSLTGSLSDSNEPVASPRATFTIDTPASTHAFFVLPGGMSQGGKVGDPNLQILITQDAPAGIVPEKIYYARKITSGSVAFYETEAKADADSDRIDLLDAGTGTHQVIRAGSDCKPIVAWDRPQFDEVSGLYYLGLRVKGVAHALSAFTVRIGVNGGAFVVATFGVNPDLVKHAESGATIRESYYVEMDAADFDPDAPIEARAEITANGAGVSYVHQGPWDAAAQANPDYGTAAWRGECSWYGRANASAPELIEIEDDGDYVLGEGILDATQSDPNHWFRIVAAPGVNATITNSTLSGGQFQRLMLENVTITKDNLGGLGSCDLRTKACNWSVPTSIASPNQQSCRAWFNEATKMSYTRLCGRYYTQGCVFELIAEDAFGAGYRIALDNHVKSQRSVGTAHPAIFSGTAPVGEMRLVDGLLVTSLDASNPLTANCIALRNGSDGHPHRNICFTNIDITRDVSTSAIFLSIGGACHQVYFGNMDAADARNGCSLRSPWYVDDATNYTPGKWMEVGFVIMDGVTLPTPISPGGMPGYSTIGANISGENFADWTEIDQLWGGTPVNELQVDGSTLTLVGVQPHHNGMLWRDFGDGHFFQNDERFWVRCQYQVTTNTRRAGVLMITDQDPSGTPPTYNNISGDAIIVGMGNDRTLASAEAYGIHITQVVGGTRTAFAHRGVTEMGSAFGSGATANHNGRGYLSIVYDASVGSFGRLYVYIYATEADRAANDNELTLGNLFIDLTAAPPTRYACVGVSRGNTGDGSGDVNGFIAELDLSGGIAPLAIASPASADDDTPAVGQTVTLQAPGVEGGVGPYSRQWSVQSAPAGSTATLDATTEQAEFTPDVEDDETVYRLRCTVTDSRGVAVYDEVVLLVAAPPAPSSITINSDGDTLSVVMPGLAGVGAAEGSGLTLSMSGGAVTANYDSIGDSAVNYSLSRTIAQGETGTASYTQPGDGLLSSGEELGDFSDFEVTNNSTFTEGGSASVRAVPGFQIGVGISW